MFDIMYHFSLVLHLILFHQEYHSISSVVAFYHTQVSNCVVCSFQKLSN